MKTIKANRERGQCVVCRKAIKKGDDYFDLNGSWVHLDCFQGGHVSKYQPLNDPFLQAIQRNSVLGIKIGKMIKQLNEIRGDKKFNTLEFVSKNFVLEEYAKVRGG